MRFLHPALLLEILNISKTYILNSDPPPCGLNVNEEQNFFAKMAINWHKIGQMPLLRMNIKWA